MATFISCLWVIVVAGYFQHYNFKTLNDIPKIVLFPPETQYSLASVILFDGGHFRGISLDIRNSPGIHVIYDGMNRGHKEMVQIISLDDPLSKIAPRYDILELWYVKVDRASSSAESGTASSTVLPMASFESTTVPPMPPNETLAMPANVLSTVLKPVGIKTLGHTCYINTLFQILFWVVPLRKGLIQKKQSKKTQKHYDQYFHWILRLTVKLYLAALFF